LGRVINKHLIGPYIIEDGIYWDQFLAAALPLLLWDVPLDIRARMCFQHDDASPLFTRQVHNLLDTNYPQKWIGHGCPVSWPVSSPHLAPLDFFLWGCLKEMSGLQKYTVEKIWSTESGRQHKVTSS
jgi:hypothetical protein